MLVPDERGERGAKRGRRGLRRRIPTCSDGRAAPCAACCQRARRRRAAASRHPLTPDRAHVSRRRAEPSVTLSTRNWRDLRALARSLARPRRRSRGPPSVSSHGAPGTTNFHRRRRDDDGGMFLPLLPPHRRGESRRRQHTVDTKNTGAAHTAHGGDTARIATDDDNDNDITIACVLRWFRSYTEDQGTHTHVCRPGRQVEEGGRGGWER